MEITRRTLFVTSALAALALMPSDASAETVEKKFTPKVSKLVRLDDGTWAPARSTGSHSREAFRVTATLPEGIGALSSYPISIVDEMDESLSPVAGTAKVLLDSPGGGDADVTAAFDIQPAAHGLIARCADILPLLKGNGTTGPLNLEYEVEVGDAGIGADHAMVNVARVEYLASPGDALPSRTPDAAARLVSWELVVRKASAGEGRPLAGAVFDVERESDGGHLDRNGAFSAKSTGLATGSDGRLRVSGVRPGTYRIAELEAPDGYRRNEGALRLEITDEVGADDARISARIIEGTGEITESDAGAGAVVITIPNERVQPPNPVAGTVSNPPAGRLPKTGDETIAAVGAAGAVGAAAVAGGIALGRRRRGADGETDAD